MNLNDLIKECQHSNQNKINNEIICNPEITNFWNDNNHEKWLIQEQNIYQSRLRPENISLEKSLEENDLTQLSLVTTQEFYNFLYNSYFVWKYTAKNRLATTRNQLQRHLDDLDELSIIQKDLFTFDKNDVAKGLEIATRIHGLGYAGASGLLAIIFPAKFGTVDQFVVKSLLQIENFPYRNKLLTIKPDSLKMKDAKLLIEILKEKATLLNNYNKTSYWTPRKVDKVLWSYRSPYYIR